jgi:2-polyprenyl-3-methyl-5-hydroxy-6-metoxy-1,4-benzoquinol methylase
VQTWDQSLAELVIAALLEPWCRPANVMPFACRVLRTDKEFVQYLKVSIENTSQSKYGADYLSSISKKEFPSSSLLRAILSSSPIPDVEIEMFLTSLRRNFLNLAMSVILNGSETEELDSMYCYLAQQCFINDYIYFQTLEEINYSQQLRNKLRLAFENKQLVPPIWMIAIACYFPLYTITNTKILTQQKWSDDVLRVLKQQIQEPSEEFDLRAAIPKLTNIDSQASLAVQKQYEENPYPRWIRLPKSSNSKLLISYFQTRFPLFRSSGLQHDRSLEMLIAGCGTGQHSISTSQLFKGVEILAVDLSMASLAYAKRKTAELDIQSINYAQADLLKLASIGRTFDVIESVGVLHHLENPLEGWKTLLSLLRPSGLMRLGFYSELARRDIVRVRKLISDEGVDSTTQAIRDYRKKLLTFDKFQEFGYAIYSSDFFSTSSCRDLLFHVEEHRMNLIIIEEFLQKNNLNFLGFDIDNYVIQSYKKRFPNDLSATNLEQWHIYEQENPDTFIGMYQFYVQRKNAYQ